MQFVTFQVGDLVCGAGVHSVQEVLRQQRLTPIPLASPVTPGLVHLRGQILTAIDLRSVFGWNPREEGAKSDCVIVHAGDEAASLLVDQIGEVLDIDAGSIHEPPMHWSDALRHYVSGVSDHANHLLLLLDADRLLAVQGGPAVNFTALREI
jgi:purine-binding chemotaxis protein CheW